jgi:hypothetical protein
LLTVAAGLFGLLWLLEIAGDPTGGVGFFTLVFAAPLLAAIGLVIATSRREDLFGRLGLLGSLLVLGGSLVPDIIGFTAAAIGLVLIALGLSERARRLLIAVAIVLAGVVGLGVRLESGDGIAIFAPILAVGVGLVAVTLLRLG